MSKKPKNETLLEQERFEVKPKSGGGILSYEVWGHMEDGKAIVSRYNIAYINHDIFQSDNSRVLGFDNAHDYHHRHYMGKIEPVEFTNFEAIQERFQQEWQSIINSRRGNKP